MAKIKNRFLPHQFLTIHDELLTGLYNLTPKTIQLRIINGEKYLVNSIKYDHCEIGLRVKVDNKYKLPDVIVEGDYVTNYYTDPVNYWMDDVDYDFFGAKLDEYSKDLCFTNMEKYLTNILFDKYLSSNQELDMTFLEIEHKYRAMASYRCKGIDKKVAMRYAKTLDSLCKKELFLITDEKFRDYRYGARNKAVYQKFLTITNIHKYGNNNLNFSYTFNGFGLIIKLSRRYSNLMRPRYYRISFNKVRWHLVAFYLSQQVFINLGLIDKHPNNQQYWQFTVNLEEMFKLSEDYKKPTIMNKPVTNYLRVKRRLVEVITDILESMPAVIDVRVEYSYNETDRFALKHQYDYDIETDLDNYQFGVKDLDQDVDVEITVILKTY